MGLSPFGGSVSSLINGKTEILGVFGFPIGHSKSPTMHNAVCQKLGINAAYLPFSPNPENFLSALDGLKALHFRGANLTIPYKEKVLPYVQELSPISKFSGSVNTLYWKKSQNENVLCGTTTDPYGALKNMEEAGISVNGKSVALLGNGGAAKAIAFALLENNANLSIICRNLSRGNELAKNLSQYFQNKNIEVSEFCNFDSQKPDIILNTTPVGMFPNINETPLPSASFRKEQFVYDIIYTPKETRLLKEAKKIMKRKK